MSHKINVDDTREKARMQRACSEEALIWPCVKQLHFVTRRDAAVLKMVAIIFSFISIWINNPEGGLWHYTMSYINAYFHFIDLIKIWSQISVQLWTHIIERWTLYKKNTVRLYIYFIDILWPVDKWEAWIIAYQRTIRQHICLIAFKVKSTKILCSQL